MSDLLDRRKIMFAPRRLEREVHRKCEFSDVVGYGAGDYHALNIRERYLLSLK